MDLYSKLYPRQYYDQRETSSTFRAEQETLLRLLRPHSGDLILEVGCGAGALLGRVEATQASIIGLDLLDSALQMARDRATSARLVLGDAVSLPFLSKTFSGIAAQHVVEHFALKAKVLEEWHRVLRVDGRLVLATPNAGFPHPDWYDDPTHQLIFNDQTLRQALENAGFSVEGVCYANPYPGHPRLVSFAARHLQVCARIPRLKHKSLTLLAVARRRA